MDRTIRLEGFESPIHWQQVPTFYADGVLGGSHALGVLRIVLGQITFDPESTSNTPALKPVCELVMQPEAIREMITYLQALPGVSDEPRT